MDGNYLIDFIQQNTGWEWSDFDEAVTFAKSLNVEKVREYIQKQKDEFDHHILNLKSKREKRNKTFES